MSSKEARRPGLVQAALAGKVTNRDAAHALGLSVRQFRRLKAAYRRAGVEGLLHGNRGRPSPRRLSTKPPRRAALEIDAPASPRSHDRTSPPPPCPPPKTRRGQLTNIRRPAQGHPWKRPFNRNLQPHHVGTGRTESLNS